MRHSTAAKAPNTEVRMPHQFETDVMITDVSPHMHMLIFLVALPGQILFGVASMTYSMDHAGRLPSFRDWLYVKAGDLSTGKLYPYLGSKGAYMCPTDRLELNSRKKITVAGGQGPMRTGKRDYSYAMNCGICHQTDTSKFIEPSKTMIYMEAVMASDDYTGMVGPRMVSETLAVRHNKRGHLVYGDLHLETLNKKSFDPLIKQKRFWFPTDDTSGPGGNMLF